MLYCEAVIIIIMRPTVLLFVALLLVSLGTAQASIRRKMWREEPVFKTKYHHPAEKVHAYEYHGEDGGVQYGGIRKKANWANGEEQGKWAADHGKFSGTDKNGWKTEGKYGKEDGHYAYHHKDKDGSEYATESYSSSSYSSSSAHH